MNCSAPGNNVNVTGTRGWVKPSEDRGTMDIIISCAITVFLCIWTSVCPNVPSPENRYSKQAILLSRWQIFLFGLIGPEFLLMGAMGQYTSARASYYAFKSANQVGWTMRHAFFADMGGVHLQFPGIESFPVNSKGLLFMVTKGYIAFPTEITEEVINDKNKSDGLTRLIGAIQISWFTLSTLSRPVKRYAMTTLELTTLAYILCALLSLFFWRHKPMDVTQPVVLNCDFPLDQIVDGHGRSAAGPYKYTPLDFITRKEWLVTKAWTYYTNILRKLLCLRSRPVPKPVRYISSFGCPPLSPFLLLAVTIVTIAYTGVFIAGWNMHFPTSTERILWRTASLGSFIVTILGGLPEMIILIMQQRRQAAALAPRQHSGIEMELVEGAQSSVRNLQPHPPTRMQAFLQKLRNNTLDKDPEMDLSLVTLVFSTPLGALYTLFRLIILIEDAMAFRELPASVFMAINWSNYVPHL